MPKDVAQETLVGNRMAKRKRRLPRISCECGPVKIGKKKLTQEFYFPRKCVCMVNGKYKTFQDVHIISYKK